MKKATLYIGSNNKTHTLEMNKIEKIVSDKFEGFSVDTGIIGFWKHSKEKSARVEIYIEDNQVSTVLTLCKELKEQLEQDAIAIEIIDSNVMFI